MKAISFIKNNAIAMSIALAAVIGFSAFKAEENLQDNITFRYQGPLNDPFSQANVQETSNWTPDSESCDSEEAQQVACSISVPLSNTMNSGSEIDPSKVTIHTSLSPAGGNNYLVSSNPNGEYTNEVNRPLPQ